MKCLVCECWHWSGKDCPSAICEVIRDRDRVLHDYAKQYEAYVTEKETNTLKTAELRESREWVRRLVQSSIRTLHRLDQAVARNNWYTELPWLQDMHPILTVDEEEASYA